MNALKQRGVEGVGANGATITDVSVSPDGEAFAYCFVRTLVVASWSTGTESFRHTCESVLESIVFAPDGRRMAGACADGRVLVLELDSTREPVVLTGEHGGYHEIAWSPNGQLIAAGHYEPLVMVFDAQSAQAVSTLDPDVFSDEGRTAVAFSPDGTWLASTAYNSIIRWSLPHPFVADGKKAKRKKLALKGHAFIVDAAFSPDGSALAGLAETEGKVALHLWESGSGRKRGRIALPGFSLRMAWSADSSFIAVIERDEPGVSLWDPGALKKSETSIEGVAMSMSAIAAHPTRVALIAGSKAGQLAIWETAE